MKICWDNLDRIKSTKGGNFRMTSGGSTYYEKVCLECGDAYLGQKDDKFCNYSCVRKNKDIINHVADKNRGKKRTAEFKLRMSMLLTGRKLSSDHIKRLSESHLGKNLSYNSKNIPTHSRFAHQLMSYEQCGRNIDDPNILEVQCTYCGKWYIPSISSVKNRIYETYNKGGGRFYCGEDCKVMCPIFNQTKYYKGQEGYTSREVQPELRQMVFIRDGYTCQRCLSNGPLHCHHIDPVASNPIESADVNNCITLCESCHKVTHELPGCTYNEIRVCKNEK